MTRSRLRENDCRNFKPLRYQNEAVHRRVKTDAKSLRLISGQRIAEYVQIHEEPRRKMHQVE